MVALASRGQSHRDVPVVPPVLLSRGVLYPAAADVLAADVELDALGANNAAALLVQHLTLEVGRRAQGAGM